MLCAFIFIFMLMFLVDYHQRGFPDRASQHRDLVHPVHLFAVCGLAVQTLLTVFKLVWVPRDIPLLLRRGPGVLHLRLLCHARTLKRQPRQD